MVADIIIIAVFALLFFIDFKRGIAITILNVAGVALTGFLAYHISNFLASWVYTAFVQQTLTTNLQQLSHCKQFFGFAKLGYGNARIFPFNFRIGFKCLYKRFSGSELCRSGGVSFGGKSYSAGYHRNVPLGYRCSYINNYLYNYKNSC